MIKASNMTDNPPCMLYLISPLDVGGDFPARLDEALAAGPVAAFQFRVKNVDEHEAARLAEPLLAICRAHDTAFIVNDSAKLAKRLKADGVHLGQGDGDVAEARSLLGHEAQIGVTCHDSRHLGMEAGEKGADYTAFGAFYPTETKETEYTAELDLLRWWHEFMELPSVAIGGITVGNAKPLIEAGADFIAVSSGVWNYDGGGAEAVRAFTKLLDETKRPQI